MKKIGMYIHFPFCVQKCYYCDFPSFAGMEGWMDRYIEAITTEMDMFGRHAASYQIDTIFMGGGTPTLFNGVVFKKLLNRCREQFQIADNAEISIECNPGTVDRSQLECMYSSGINRLSIGLQSWQDHHLIRLGRIHTCSQFVDTYHLARQAGFKNINVDVMYALPGQTGNEWLETLTALAMLGVDHLSAYGLKIEEETPFYHSYHSGTLELPEEDEERWMYHRGIDLLSDFGFDQYEISNFAKVGYFCRHNLNYWRNGEYIGFGSGAHSYLQGLRRGNLSDIRTYVECIEQGRIPVDSEERIDRETEVLETIMLGLRLKEGIQNAVFYDRFGFSLFDRYQQVIGDLEKQGFLVVVRDTILPTKRGFDFQNVVVRAFMDGI